MYSRKWTQIQFNEGYRLLRQQRNIMAINANPMLQFPLVDYKKGYPLKDEYEQAQDQKLINNLFDKYPELKYIPFNHTQPGQFVEDHIALKFIKKQKQYIEKGFTKQKSFEITEELYQQQMQKRVDSQIISTNLAMTNNARSFMSYYQQQAEYESRLKAKRIERDWDLQKLDQKQQQKLDAKKLQDKLNQDNLHSIDNIDDFRDDLITKYQKTLYKIVELDRNQPSEEIKQKQHCDELVKRTKNLFQHYYKRAAIKDKLSGLTDLQIQQSLLESPKKIQNNLSKILKKLDKYGVKLNSEMELVIPSGAPTRIKEILNTQEFKMALMYRDIQFEQKHKSHLNVIDKKLAKLQEQYRLLSIDNEIAGQDYNEKKQNNDKIQNVLQKSAIIVPKESTYKLFETPEQRMIRLEIKWWEQKSNMMEISRLEELLQEEPNKEKMLDLEQRKQRITDRLNTLVDRLRYVKFQLEQVYLKETGQLIFNEHKELVQTKNIFRIAGQIKIEELEQYYKIPYDLRRITTSAAVNDENIMKMIQRKPLKSGVYDLRKGTPINKANEHDLVNFGQQENLQQILESRALSKMYQFDAANDEQDQEQQQDTIIQDIVDEDVEIEQGDNKQQDDNEDEDGQEEAKLKAFIARSKEFQKQNLDLEQNKQKQKDAELSKNKNLKKKK